MKYKTYRDRLRRSDCRLSCDRCDDDSVLRSALDRERHASEAHGLRSGTGCPWCWTAFPAAGAARNVGHLARCFELVVFERAVAAVGCWRRPFPCCGLRRDVRGFDAHVRSAHGLPLDDDCVWCGDRRTTQRHRRECLARRPELVVVPDPEVVRPPPPTESSCRVCAAFDASERRCLMGGRPSPAPGDARLYLSFGETEFLRADWFSRPDDGRTVRFDERCGLGSDAPFFVRRFVDLAAEAGSDAVSWFHFFVRADAFSGFVDAFSPFLGSRVGMLPFWCMCDGGGRVHRHGIAVARTAAAFHEAYRRVRFDDRGDRRDEKCKGFRRIATAQHLVNAICYVGGERSRCVGEDTREDDPLAEGKGTGCHYRLNRPVSRHARMYLSASVPGGLAEYLRWRHGNRDVHAMRSLSYDRRGSAFFVSVRELLDLEPRGCPVPLAWDLQQLRRLQGTADLRVASEELWALDDAEPVRLERFVGGDRRVWVAERPPFVEGLPDSEFRLSARQQRFARHVRETERRVRAEVDGTLLQRDRVPELEAEAAVRDAEVRTLRDRVAELEEEEEDKRRDMAREAEVRTLRDRVAELEAVDCGERRLLRERVAELEAVDCGERSQMMLRERVAELEATLRDLRKDSVHADVVSALRLEHAGFVSALRLEHAALVELIRGEHRAELRDAEGRVRALLEERFSTVVRLLEERIDGHVEEKRDLAGRNRALTVEAGDLRTQVGGLFAGLVSLLRTWFRDDQVGTKRRRLEDGV